MKPKFIFDLSEVLIMGLFGIEKTLSPILNMPENEILPCFGGDLLQRFCRGEISEEMYLQRVIQTQNWKVQSSTLKMVIRGNFHREVEGSQAILEHLANRYEVVLLSDHAREWVTYIREIHFLFDVFDKVFFSYELGATKKQPETFEKVLQHMEYAAQDCWLIDDSAANIKVAASLGIRGVQFKHAEQLKTELIKHMLW